MFASAKYIAAVRTGSEWRTTPWNQLVVTSSARAAPRLINTKLPWSVSWESPSITTSTLRERSSNQTLCLVTAGHSRLVLTGGWCSVGNPELLVVYCFRQPFLGADVRRTNEAGLALYYNTACYNCFSAQTAIVDVKTHFLSECLLSSPGSREFKRRYILLHGL